MSPAFTPAFIAEWIQYLRNEMNHQEQVLGQCDKLTQAIMSIDTSGIEKCQSHLAFLQSKHVDLERKRDALRLASARHLDINVATLQMAAIIDLSPEPESQSLKQATQALRTMLEQVRFTQDRNQMLMRTSLGLIKDTLAVIVGESDCGGYQRSGQARAHQAPRGNILNFQA